MSLGERCDEILRIIDEALEEGCGKGVPRCGDGQPAGPTGSPASSEPCAVSGRDMGAARRTSQPSGSIVRTGAWLHRH